MHRLLTALAIAICGAALAGCANLRNAPSATAPIPGGVGPNGKKLYYSLIFSNATPGQEEEFNRWYDRIHAPVMIESGDFVWAQRFALTPDQAAGNNSEFTKRKYLVIFAYETDDLQKHLADTRRRLALPRNVSSPALDYSSLRSASFEALGPPITQKQAQKLLAEETAAGRVPPPDAPIPPGGVPSPFDALRRSGAQAPATGEPPR